MQGAGSQGLQQARIQQRGGLGQTLCFTTTLTASVGCRSRISFRLLEARHLSGVCWQAGLEALLSWLPALNRSTSAVTLVAETSGPRVMGYGL